jgi:hypothetical protein
MTGIMLAWVTVVGGLFLAAIAVALKLRTRRMLNFEREAGRFFAAIDPLLEDDETPESVVLALGVINAHLFSGSLARHILFAMVRKRGPARPANADEVAAFFKRRPELQDPFLRAICFGLGAISYRSRFLGVLLRRMVLYDVRRNPQRATETALSISGDDTDYCRAAA